MASILFHSQTLNYKLDLVGGRFLRINQVVDRVEHRTPPAMPECKFGAAQKFFSHELPTFFSFSHSISNWCLRSILFSQEVN